MYSMTSNKIVYVLCLICFSGKQYLLLKVDYFLLLKLDWWMHLTFILLRMILVQFRLCVKFFLLSRWRWIIMMLMWCPDETQTASFCIFIYQIILFLSKICTKLNKEAQKNTNLTLTTLPLLLFIKIVKSLLV